jgi:predicted RNA-binding Zn-ribbon protein involved in translation (DUF1610 family)
MRFDCPHCGGNLVFRRPRPVHTESHEAAALECPKCQNLVVRRAHPQWWVMPLVAILGPLTLIMWVGAERPDLFFVRSAWAPIVWGSAAFLSCIAIGLILNFTAYRNWRRYERFVEADG